MLKQAHPQSIFEDLSTTKKKKKLTYFFLSFYLNPSFLPSHWLPPCALPFLHWPRHPHTPPTMLLSIPLTVFQISVSKMVDPGLELCALCATPIYDQFFCRVLLDKVISSFHEDCLCCATCKAPLNGSCFVRDGALFCKQDYDR